MNRDPGLICFKHCKSDIFVFSVPKSCPECNADLTTNTDITPFSIPFPFTRASQYPCSLVLRPTNGDFLRSYSNNADLHIGVTNSRGNIFSYDEHGLKEEPAKDWDECLSIQCNTTSSDVFETSWDSALNTCLQSENWVPERYNEDNYNCYTFVLSFLTSVPMCPLNQFTCDRETFWASGNCPSIR
ncbi:Hypothetical predicted protein [Cloeon dipterum]|uniref:MKRN2 opposite strand protein n=1 Tax=Cloeon dipterum TaxID=197152 RepID=A0A8S1CIY6_9INSE|nr:Hypothetical predicted protein [Cloeon dipterum]